MRLWWLALITVFFAPAIAITTPSNIVAYVPITLVNNQNSAVAANTPLAIGVTDQGAITGFNALAYQQYETCNLNNAEFFFANGTIINSWMEGNILNENTANSACTSDASANALAGSANILYWVEYNWPSSFLPANTGIAVANTIYLGWTSNVLNSQPTLSNTVTGEAPQLSSTYAEYDNGANVFSFYDNFAGTSLNTSKWSQGSVTGTFSVDNGAELTGSDPSMWLYGKIAVPTSIFEVYIPSSVSGSWQIRNGWSLTQGDATNYDVNGGINGWNLESALGSFGISPGTQQYTSGGYIQTLIWSATGSEQAYENYANELSGTNTQYTWASTSYPSIWLAYSSSGTATDVVQWARTRAYPPNGVMPGTTLGAAVKTETYYIASCNATGSKSASCNLPGVSSPGNFCWGGDGNAALNTPSWPVLAASAGSYAEVGNTYASSSCSDSSTQSDIAVAGLEVMTTSGTPQLSNLAGAAAQSATTSYTYSYSTNSIASGQPAATALMVSCGFYECTSIAWPSGCTQQFLQSGGDNFETVALALCNQTGQNTYNVIATLSNSGAVAVSSAVYSGGLWGTGLYSPPATPSVNSLPLSPAQMDAGQSLTLTAHISSGGTAPYTYNYLFTNTITNAIVFSQQYTNQSTTNAFVWTAPSAYVGNTIEVNVLVTDSHPTTVNSPYTGVITINPKLSAVTLTPSNTAIDMGQSVTFAASWSGGSQPYSASLYSSSTPSCNQGSTLLQQRIGITSTSATFSPLYPVYDTYYCAFVADNTPEEVPVIGTIASGMYTPLGASISPSGTYAYVLNYGNGSGNIVIIDTETNAVTASVSNAIGAPTRIAFSPSGTYAYASYAASNSISIIDTATNTVVNTISNGFSYPYGIAFSPSGAYAYVANFESNNVVIIDTATNTVVGSIAGGMDRPIGAAFSPSGTYVYVINYASGNALIVNTATNSVIGAVSGAFSSPAGIAFSPSGAYAYVTNQQTDNLSVIYAAANSAQGSVSSADMARPTGIAFSPSGAYAYIVNQLSNSITIINTSMGTANSADSYVAINPAPAVFLSETPSSGNVYAYGTIAYTATVTGGTEPFSYSFRIYNSVTNTLVNSTIYSGLSASGNTFAFTPNANLIGDTLNANVLVVDATGATANSAPAGELAIVAAPSSRGAGKPSAQTVVLGDNLVGSETSNAAVIYAYVVGSGAANASEFSQSQLPAAVTVPQSDYLNFSFACSFTSPAGVFVYEGDVYGIGSGHACGENYTVYGSATYEVIYGKASQTTSNSIVAPPSAQSSNKTATVNSTAANSTARRTTSSNASATSNALPVNSTRKINTTASNITSNTANAISPPTVPQAASPAWESYLLVAGAAAIILVLLYAVYMRTRKR